MINIFLLDVVSEAENNNFEIHAANDNVIDDIDCSCSSLEEPYSKSEIIFYCECLSFTSGLSAL